MGNLKDKGLLKNQPWIVWGLLVVQVLVFLGMLIRGWQIGVGFDGSYVSGILIEFGALNKELVMVNHDYGRLLTPIFVHIGLMHLLVNSVTLYFLGSQLEALIGHTRFLMIYLLSGLTGNLLSLAMSQPNSISAGASTSLFGLFAFFVAYGRVYRHQPAIRFMAKQMGTLIIVNLIFNLFSSQIDMWGHIGGAIGGFLLGFIVTIPALKGSDFAKENQDVHRTIRAIMAFLFFTLMCFIYAYRQYN